jgi:transcriptional regulator with XRE-family HTH domain
VAKPRIQVDGSKVKAARDAKGWSQETLAKKTRYKLSVIQKFEQGTYVSRPCLKRVAEVLDVREDDLLVTDSTSELGDPPPAGRGLAKGDLVSPKSGGPLPTGANPFQESFLDLNKETLKDPSLLEVYDLGKEPHPKDKLHAFAYMCLNVFEIGYSLYEAPHNRDVCDPLYKSWYDTLEDFVNNSSWAQNILSRKDSKKVYNAGFLAFAKALIQKQ